MREQTIFQKRRLRLVAAKGTSNHLFNSVLKVRRHGGDTCRFEFDEYSTHYVLFEDSVAVGALTSTGYLDGPIDCAEKYPSEVFRHFGSEVVSTCKFRILNTRGLRTLRCIVRNVWKHRLSLGVRLDLINIRVSDRRVFERIGYQKIHGSEFIHPTLGTDSIAMMMCVDPDHRSFVTDVFRGAPNPVSFARFQHFLEPVARQTRSRFPGSSSTRSVCTREEAK